MVGGAQRRLQLSRGNCSVGGKDEVLSVGCLSKVVKDFSGMLKQLLEVLKSRVIGPDWSVEEDWNQIWW